LTGPGPGKLEVNAVVELCDAGGCRRIPARVYIHLRGWSRARVTHIDIESPGLEELVGGPRHGIYVRVYGLRDGIVITPLESPSWRLTLKSGDPLLHPLPHGETCIGYLGGKTGGLYLGLQSPYHRELEKLAILHRGVYPRGRTRKPARDEPNGGDEAPSGA
jgi:hypothetical protein